MMKMKVIWISLGLLFTFSLQAQDDLLQMLEEETSNETYVVEATFKGTRLINGHSIETRKKKNLDFIISHRFGRVNLGAYELYGLDQSNIRLGLDYGVMNAFNIGIGRNSFEKTYDGYLKYRVLKQTYGNKSIPVSATLFSSLAIKTAKDPVFEEVINFYDRISFAHQILIARKFSSSLSLQFMPTYLHFNSLTESQLRNDIFGIGAGGRVKLTQRISLNVEYYYVLDKLSENTHESISIGFDIETGGHVFQLHFTNSQAMIEKGFIAETRDDFLNGDIHFGFNISRTFQLGGK